MRRSWLAIGLTLMLVSGNSWGEENPLTAETETSAQTDPSLSDNETAGNVPLLGSESIVSEEIVEGRTGYVHPFLTLGGFYTDNLFRAPGKEQSESAAIITPGLWLAFPARNQRLSELSTSNITPGGLALSRFTTESERRFQGYALYRADIREYARFQDENRVDHRGEGLLKISLRSGLSLELADVFERNRDPYGTGGTDSRKLDTFDANLFNVILVSRLSPKLQLRADYGHYRLDYAADRNTYRNRSDDSYSGYVFFQATSRAAVFVQGEYITIDYDEEIKHDSHQENYYLGVQMQPSAKTRGRFKVGYGMQEYPDDHAADADAFLAEAQLDYLFTSKTSVYLRGTRRILESDQAGARSILSHRALLGCRQRISSRWQGEASIFFNRNDYAGIVTIGPKTDMRLDDEFGGVAALGFSPLKWMSLNLGYEYRERDSTFDSQDYRSNTLFLRVTAVL